MTRDRSDLDSKLACKACGCRAGYNHDCAECSGEADAEDDGDSCPHWGPRIATAEQPPEHDACDQCGEGDGERNYCGHCHYWDADSEGNSGTCERNGASTHYTGTCEGYAYPKPPPTKSPGPPVCVDCGLVHGDETPRPEVVCAADAVCASGDVQKLMRVAAECLRTTADLAESDLWEDGDIAMMMQLSERLNTAGTATLRSEYEVRAEERERCARIAEPHSENHYCDDARMPCGPEIAAAIRAMGDDE